MAKNYIRGSAKMVKTQYGEILNISLNMEDLQKLPQYKGYVRLTIAPRKEIGKFGDTHSIFENDYKPDVAQENTGNEPKKTADEEDLPF